MRSYIWVIMVLAMLSGATQLVAGEPAVLDATAQANANGTYSFTVTIAHGDEGWSHYANKWEVVSPDGQVLGTRTIFHPHVDEQPFTRSLSQVEVPIGVREVTIRAFDSVHGEGSRTFSVTLPPRR